MNTPNAWPQGEETVSSTLLFFDPTFAGIALVVILAGIGLILYLRKRKIK